MCGVVSGVYMVFFFFKQKTAYEMRISDWSSDVCSSDLRDKVLGVARDVPPQGFEAGGAGDRLAVVGWGSTYGPISRAVDNLRKQRSEERRVGKECVSTCRSRWSPYH